ncbi:hypothetical protein H8356DRAFT_1615621 [Neocallimastix lanati (nom. inval.)]|nr:hypothetical protein H8356DRAFT_1615621 [Neocallimastix sp. JGI-2020a]
MKILYYEFLVLFIYGVLANKNYVADQKRVRCSASRLCPLKVEYRNSTLSEIELKDHKYRQCCSSFGFCGETIEYCGAGCRFGACLKDIEKAKNRSTCYALNSKGRCTTDCPCADGAECSEDGFCMSQILSKRFTCSTLRAKGRCSIDCPCPKSGQCCSKYGYCGDTEKYCDSSSSSSSKKTTKKSTTTKDPTRSSSYGSTVSVHTASSPGVIIYLPSYRLDSEIDIDNYDLSRINVINYCFFQITNDGEAYSGNYDMDVKHNMIHYVNNDVKEKYPHLKVILSIGGTKGSKNFKYFLNNSSTRDKAAQSIVKAVIDYKFDGLDVDWEFPKSEEEAGYLLAFLKKIREYMGYEKYLTLSSSALTSRYYGLVPEMEPLLNWFNLMTYHYSGYWDKYSGFNAPLYPADSDLNRQKDSDYTVDSYLAEGVPAKKLILGAPFMGQAWKVESSSNNGYNQRGDANILGEKCNLNYEGFWSYRSLREEGILISKRTTSSEWVRTWHDDVRSPTIFNKGTSIYISYDDADSMCERARYVKKKEIGGIMVWEAGQDYKRELLDGLLSCY